MRIRDIYDTMPDGADQRRHNQYRLAQLERDGAARRARLAKVLARPRRAGWVPPPA